MCRIPINPLAKLEFNLYRWSTIIQMLDERYSRSERVVAFSRKSIEQAFNNFRNQACLNATTYCHWISSHDVSSILGSSADASASILYTLPELWAIFFFGIRALKKALLALTMWQCWWKLLRYPIISGLIKIPSTIMKNNCLIIRFCIFIWGTSVDRSFNLFFSKISIQLDFTCLW